MNVNDMKTNGSLTDEQFIRFTALISDRTGMHFESNRREIVERRILTRLRTLGAISPDDYYNHLIFHPGEFDELVNILVSIVNNLF